MTRVGGYYDIEQAEREKFLELDGVGEVTADLLVEHYDLFENAVERLLGDPNAYHGRLGQDTCDELRETLQAAGYEPPCECSHYEDVQRSQDRDDVLSYCQTCGVEFGRPPGDYPVVKIGNVGDSR